MGEVLPASLLLDLANGNPIPELLHLRPYYVPIHLRNPELIALANVAKGESTNHKNQRQALCAILG